MAKEIPKYPENVAQMMMEPGFYEIQVLIQSTQGLILNEGIDIDAMISIQAFGQIKFSKPKPQVGHQMKIWGQHYSITKNFAITERQELQKSMIYIKVWDHRKVLKDALVGEYQINIQRIYQRDRHILEHQTIALSDINDNFGQISGLIKLSILVAGEKDKRVPLKMEPASSSQKNNNIMLPPHIERKSYQLAVDIYEGRDIKPVDGSSVDAYIGVEFGMIYSRTEAIVNTTDPVWNQKVEVPVHTPSKISNIILRLIDSNLIMKKQVIGSCYLSLSKLIYESENLQDQMRDSFIHRYDRKKWINIYGAQKQAKNNVTKHKYSIYPDHAPAFVGSILIQASMEQRNNPIKEHTKLPNRNNNGFINRGSMPFIYYTIEVQLEMGMNLPEGSKLYALEVRIGGDSLQKAITKLQKNNFGFITWFTKLSYTVKFYENQDFPDVFVYLVNDDNNRICFRRHKPDFQKGITNKWRMLKPDLTMIKIHSQQAGYVKYGITIQKAAKNKAKKMQITDQRLISQSFIGTQQCYIVIDLYCAQGLLAGDDDGSTDPYFKFNFQSKTAFSSTKPSTLNPIYLERIIIDGVIGANNHILPMFVTAYNKNPIRDQTIGICYIDLENGLKKNQVTKNKQRNNKPKWFDLVIEDIKLGRFLAGITIIQKKNKLIPERDLVFQPEQLKSYNICLSILGLRNLTNEGLVSIRKPYVEFDFDSLYAYGSKQVKKRQQGVEYIKQDKQSKLNQFTKNIKTEPVEFGTSVNIKTSSKTQIKLPTNTELWPTLSAKVMNYVIGGLFEPVIGYFSIDLKEAQKRTVQLKARYLNKERRLKYEQLSENVNNTHKLASIDKDIIRKLRTFVVRNVNYNWSEMSPQTAQKLNKLVEGDKITDRKLDPNYLVVIPKYVYNDDKDTYVEKYKQLVNGEYMKIGYDSKERLAKIKKQDRNRHYRYCLDETYEDYYQRAYGVNLGVYDEIAIKKGRVLLPQEKDEIFTRVFSEQDMEVGFYKGNCLINQKKQSVNSTIGDQQFEKTSERMLAMYMRNVKTRMYLYILSADGLPPKRYSSNPNPFIVVKMGDKQRSFKSQVVKEQMNPKFNLLIKEDLQFPANSEITIEVRDLDFTGLIQQKIGQTVLHAENRVFSQFGKVQFNNPVQTHTLTVQQSKQSQGTVKFWVDFIPLDQIDLYKQFDIASKADNQFELRVVVWSCSDVSSNANDFTDLIDLYVTCQFNNEIKETDVHYRAQNGEGSFNWRMIFPFKWPVKDDLLYVKVYDKELVLSNADLAYGNKSLGAYIEEAYGNQTGVKIFEGEEDMHEQKGWPCSAQQNSEGNKLFDVFPMELTINKHKEGEQYVQQTEQGAKVYMSIEILPKAEAVRKKVGEGQSEPNNHPHLPKPEGRIKWSWNPITLIGQLFGKKFKTKICILLCIALLITAAVFIFPSYVGSILGRI